jgi:hypothetical protein
MAVLVAPMRMVRVMTAINYEPKDFGYDENMSAASDHAVTETQW